MGHKNLKLENQTPYHDECLILVLNLLCSSCFRHLFGQHFMLWLQVENPKLGVVSPCSQWREIRISLHILLWGKKETSHVFMLLLDWPHTIVCPLASNFYAASCILEGCIQFGTNLSPKGLPLRPPYIHVGFGPVDHVAQWVHKLVHGLVQLKQWVWCASDAFSKLLL